MAGAGKGAPESPRYARVIFLKAAELGDGDAALALARMLLDGKGGTPGSAERDRAQGLVYAARALELGNARALRTLSFRYREQLKADLALEMAVQLEEAERGGESTAPLRLAQALNNLERPPWTQIVALCKRALSFASVDGGDRANCMRLLELANRSLGALPEGAPKEVNPIAPRAKRAEVLLTRAQELGQAADPTSLFEARLHTHLAARLRNPKAMRSIASQMREGVGGPVDLTLARLWEQRAHEAE